MSTLPYRNLAALSGETFDLVVIGAGIHGAGIAWEAAARGWRVALLDQGDFGHAASANSLKIIHGGFRYLQNADLVRMRQSIRARRQLLTLAPHLVHPFPCVVPTKGVGLRSKLALAGALTANAVISCDRNEGVPESSQIPAGRILSRDEFHAAVPGVKDDRITGGALWYDAFAENTERLTLSVAMTARACGAVTANYVRAEEVIAENGAVSAVRVTDGLTNDSIIICTRGVVVAAGPWRHLLKLPPQVPENLTTWLDSYNIVVNRNLFGKHAVGLESRSEGIKRNLFFAPWRGGTIIGTHYKPWAGTSKLIGMAYESWPGEHPKGGQVRPEVLDEFMSDIHKIYPGSGLSIRDVTFVHIGLLPARPGASTPESKSRVLDSRLLGGIRGLVVTEGVKYTTGLVDAHRAVDLAAMHLGHAPACTTKTDFYGGGEAITAERIKGEALRAGLALTDLVASHLVEYGSCFRRVLKYAANEADLAQPVAPNQPVLKAEVVFAVRDEMACHLSDVVMRRAAMGSFQNPGDAALHVVADIMARELSWNAERVIQELADVRRLYPQQ